MNKQIFLHFFSKIFHAYIIIILIAVRVLARWRGILGGWRLEKSPPVRGLLLADGVRGAEPRRGAPSGVPQGCECGGRYRLPSTAGGVAGRAFPGTSSTAGACAPSVVCRGAPRCAEPRTCAKVRTCAKCVTN